MDYDYLNNIESCYVDIPPLLYYSHIPTSVVVLIFSIFLLMKNKENKLVNWILFCIAVLFSLWNILDLLIWHTYSSVTMIHLWSFFGILYALINILCLYFLYVFVEKRDVTNRVKIFVSVFLLPVFMFAPTDYNLPGFDIENCQPIEGVYYNGYVYLFGITAIFSIVYYVIYKFIKTKKRQVIFLGMGVLLFLASFSWAELLGSITEDFTITQYGLFGAPVFIGFLVYSILRFNTYNIKLLSTQIFVSALAILVGSLMFLNDLLYIHIIAFLTFVIVCILGWFLIRSVKKVDEQREALDISNKQQTNLLHFISHQVKGFFTKSRNIFSGMIEGDYGPLPEPARKMVLEGFESDNRGVQTVEEILRAANFKTGQTTYSMTDTNLVNVIKDIILTLKPSADLKKLALNFNPSVPNLIINADTVQITQALKNLIDNSIKYTPAGKIDITLESSEEKVIIKVQDTGVGITPEDVKNIFKEGGRGKDSLKINVNSTGYGLYIVKNIIEAHGGTVTAYSEGQDKGSTFTVVLPGK